MSERLVVIGNGMAAARFVEELAQRALGRYAIAVIGEEPRLAYNRVLLSSVLAGEVPSSEIELRPARWWSDRGVTLRYGLPVTSVRPANRSVMLADGVEMPFSRLVFATGSRPIRLPLPGADLAGVLTFRDVGDVGTITRAAAPGAPVVVIGGGLLGLEAAYGLAKAGARVSVVHLMDRLMECQLDARASTMLRQSLAAKGINVLLEAETKRFVGTQQVKAVELADGRILPAAAVVVAVGIKPNVNLARAAGLAVGRGIVVDDGLATSVADIHAVGECAEHRGRCYGLVEPAYEQARVLAVRFAGRDMTYAGSVLATNLKVSGVNVFSAGDFLGTPGTEEIVFADPGLGTYKKLVVAEDRLVGTVLFGDTADGLWYLDLIRTAMSIEKFRGDLAFGRALVERLAA
jgi:nitrite reductase (NADH) large subunit